MAAGTLFDQPFRPTPLVLRLEERWGIDLATYIEEAYYVVGMTEVAIAEELGCSPGSIHLWRRQLGLPSFQRDRRAAFEMTSRVLAPRRRAVAS